jgi:hypothetical protein
MANSTTNIDTISQSQASKEVTANAYFDAASPASLFGRRGSTSTGLTWGYYGGTLFVDGVATQVANGTVALSASTTNYVEATRAGVVSSNTSGFTTGRMPLYTVVTGASTVTSYTDHRTQYVPFKARISKAMADAAQTLTHNENRADVVVCTGALTAQRNLTVAHNMGPWIVYNNTTGGFGVQVLGATGTGIVIAATKHAIVYSDGTNIVRATADA